jgi:hypothetical protein
MVSKAVRKALSSDLKAGQHKGETPSRLIDARIRELGDWRGRDTVLDSHPNQASRPGHRRGVEVERGSGLVSRGG